MLEKRPKKPPKHTIRIQLHNLMDLQKQKCKVGLIDNSITCLRYLKVRKQQFDPIIFLLGSTLISKVWFTFF